MKQFPPEDFDEWWWHHNLEFHGNAEVMVPVPPIWLGITLEQCPTEPSQVVP